MIDQEVQLLLEVIILQGGCQIVVKQSLIGNNCMHKRNARLMDQDKMFES